jgi:sigma-B regulation protein RsbU (phosphoserine phosphatase)
MGLFSSNKDKVPAPPTPSKVPQLKTAQLAALYRAARVGGDFYDFYPVGGAKLLFLLLDIAGKRETALKVAASVQEYFRKRADVLFGPAAVDDSDAITKLLLDLNRQVMTAAGGVICAPAFLGCYDEEINTLTYINAGHTPGLLKDDEGTLLLNANGLPLGLFSHATHDSQFCALEPGAAVLLVSKGLVESKSSNDEFGIENVQKVLESSQFATAEAICSAVLDAVEKHEKQSTRFGPSLYIPGFKDNEPNDHTTVVLMRNAAVQTAAAGD